MAELEDKYSRFFRETNIDLQAEIAAGGSGDGLTNYYTKTETNSLLAVKAPLTVTDSLDDRVTELEENPGGGVTDHGALTGLADDDHTQYHNDTRGDARYYTKTQSDINYQPLDSDLTAIAGLSATNNDVVQRKSGAWTNRTPAQLKTDLALTKTDVGLSNVDNTTDAGKPVSTATQTALDGKANSSHTHATADITSGTLDIARIPTGSSGTTVSLGNHTHTDKADVSNTPRYLMFSTTWPARPADSRMTFYIGGDPDTDSPTDSVAGDVWIPNGA